MDFMNEGKKDNTFKVVLAQNITKTSLSLIADSIFDDIENGYKDSLEVYIQAKGLEELAKQIQERVKEHATTEANNYGKQDSVRLGVPFFLKASPKRYSFNHDESWVMLNSELEKAKERLKEQESKMIEATKYSQLADEFGVVITPAIIVSEGAEILQVSIPKK
jgi:hypothetical protein